jgi:hypothetical protein
MLCPKCNRPVIDGARFCGSCGTAVQSSAADAQGTVIRPPSRPSGEAAASAAGMSGSASSSAAWSNATARLPGLMQRIKNILLTPKTEWPAIELEPTSIGQLYTGYIMPLAAFAALMSFIHMSVIGVSVPFLGSYRTPLASGLVYAVVSFGIGLLGLFLVGLIINGLAPTFSGQRDQRQAMKTAAYALTPAWLSSVLSLLPGLATLLQLLAGIYGIYLLYLGLPQLMRSPRDKAFGYTAAVVICTILMGIVLGAIGAATGVLGGYGRFGGLHAPALSQQQQQQNAAAAVGNVLGSVLGTDDKGKAGLGAALNSLAQAGAKMEAEQRAASNSARPEATLQTVSSPADAANAAAATAGLLTALGGALGGNHPVDPVDFRALKAMLPDSLPGMQRVGAQGNSQQALGVRESSATANYQGPAGVRAEIKISDLSGVSGLLDVANAVAQNTNSESDTGYEKDTSLGGRRVHEKYDSRSKHGELNTIVARRFSVDVTGEGVEMRTLEQYASNIDFARLEAMKDQGARTP